jgi:hypothetical protein
MANKQIQNLRKHRIFFNFFILEPGNLQAGLKITILLSWPPEYWNYRDTVPVGFMVG